MCENECREKTLYEEKILCQISNNSRVAVIDSTQTKRMISSHCKNDNDICDYRKNMIIETIKYAEEECRCLGTIKVINILLMKDDDILIRIYENLGYNESWSLLSKDDENDQEIDNDDNNEGQTVIFMYTFIDYI